MDRRFGGPQRQSGCSEEEKNVLNLPGVKPWAVQPVAWVWRLFDRVSSSWNNLKCQLDTTRQFYWCILNSTCFGHIRPSSGALEVLLQHMVLCTKFLDGWWSWELLRRSCVRCGCCRATSAPQAWPTQPISRPPPIQKLGAQNHMLQLNIRCSWWWAYVPETRRAKNTSIKLPCCIKLAFQVISYSLGH